MTTKEIKIGGLGGQGVILSGMIIGKAAALFDNKHATMTQAFGPEARGSACSAQLIVSDDAVLYPYVNRPEILVTMSQDAYAKFTPALADGGLLLIEEELVKVDDPPPNNAKVYGIPATRIAEELGRKLVLNIVMVGFFTAIAKLIEPDAMRKAVEASVPPGTERLNLSAFDKGFEHGQSLLA
ncbi:MAG: 2-oxoacid:acceptor oxidoreductase family protein [Deltaproteobacteria bacterium]|jgi:2-oxoglutarate ferredoxin oxidoreductase subunit gamma|nr:2-oxoacid:acceptor oxidoreductase family protein [Deltaproteobacteria bacterium]MBW2531680.1 2-oxoacid:acceptor oxidoreductase family protein [Deltaproteobacteria bacterium]